MKFTLSQIEIILSDAVSDHCSCGGRGPDDIDVCEACMIYHKTMNCLVDLDKQAEKLEGNE